MTELLCRYFQSHKTVWHTNQLSSHEWFEIVLINKWEVHGPGGLLGTYKSDEKASAACDEWEAFHRKFPFTPPVGKFTGK